MIETQVLRSSNIIPQVQQKHKNFVPSYDYHLDGSKRHGCQSDSTRSSSLQTDSSCDSDNQADSKEYMSSKSESCDQEMDSTLSGSKTLSDGKKQRKLTLKELQKRKKKGNKQFKAFEIEESKKNEETLKNDSKVNFEKCLNLFTNKNFAGKNKGTKPINPKINSIQTSGFPFGNSFIPQTQEDPSTHFAQSQKYKTEICKNFEVKGKCKWGENCCFAHGKNELRKKTLFNYFYKTKICKHFNKNGFCPYASRCQYFHFKKYQIYQELFESFSNKLYSRINENNKEVLDNVLERTERVTKRLPIFSKLTNSVNTDKSLYEKFDLDHF